ncbi:MAG: DUF4864 domain-containing protein [Salinirussus sp.]
MDRWLRGLCCLLLVLGVGCVSALDGSGAAETPSPAPAAGQATKTTALATGTETPGAAADRSSDSQPRYLSLRPTCERPPGSVIHIQVMALANNDVDPDEGINTTYRFVSGGDSGPAVPPRQFVRNIKFYYEPLLAADRVSYGSLHRSGTTAFRNVTVSTNIADTTYNWTVERRAEGQRAGCWQTAGIVLQTVNTSVGGE